MKIEQLCYFLDIANSKSITKTAQNFFISQQAVSKAVHQLEEEFQVPLLRRRQYGVELTTAGESFLDGAKKILACYEQMQQQLNPHYQSIKDAQNQLKILIHPQIQQLSFNLFLEQFMKAYPAVKPSIAEADINFMTEMLGKNIVDVGIVSARSGSPFFAEEHLLIHPVTEVQIYACFSRSHVLNGLNEPLGLSDLVGQNLLSTASPNTLENYLYNDRHDANLYFCNNIFSQHNIIEKGLAVAIVTKPEGLKLVKNYPALCVKPIIGLTNTIAILFARNRPASLAATYFSRLFIQYYTNNSQL